MDKIRIAFVGVGNCCSSLVQGLNFYKAEEIGLMHKSMGGYEISDIQICAAFDIDSAKVGRDVSEAIFSGNNCTKIFSMPPLTGIIVKKGPVLDGIGKYISIDISNEKQCDVAEELRKNKADILINYLPVGSQKATEFYANAAIDAGCAFINCMPVFIASEPSWERKFREKGLPVIGDDIKSQVGATIVHRVLTNLFKDRGVKLDRTYQLNVGGNTDFLNMLERERLKYKKISKTESVQSQTEKRLEDRNIHVGPSDFVPWLNDNKICFIRMEGRGFGGVPMEIELRMSVEDSPNSAGVVIDAIRCAKIAKDRGIGGVVPVSSYFMKHPPEQYTDSHAKKIVEDFISNK